jgi:hypothetical protein
MAGNTFTYQVLKDTTERAVIKLTGKFDGSGQEDNPNRIAANSLYGALDANNVPLHSALSVSNTAQSFYNLSIHRLWYDCVNAVNADVDIYWNANPTVSALIVSGTYEYDGNSNWVTIPNAANGAPGVTACNGDIGIRTRGMQANSSYTIIMEVRKDNAYYQRGQFNDPAAFNYGEYSLRPHG